MWRFSASGRLNNDMDELVLSAPDGTTIVSVAYADRGWWRREADGEGYSLVAVGVDPNDPANWRPSATPLGSPGADDGVLTVTQAEIIRHPQDAIVTAGETAEFSVFAYGHPDPSYQWERDGAPVPGAEGPVLTTVPIGAEDQARGTGAWRRTPKGSR